MVTGRNWTRKSIEELVEGYMKEHGGKPQPSKFEGVPNHWLLPILNQVTTPDGYSIGAVPDVHRNMYRVGVERETSMDAYIFETYHAYELLYYNESSYSKPIAPYRWFPLSNSTWAPGIEPPSKPAQATLDNGKIFMIASGGDQKVVVIDTSNVSAETNQTMFELSYEIYVQGYEQIRTIHAVNTVCAALVQALMTKSDQLMEIFGETSVLGLPCMHLVLPYRSSFGSITIEEAYKYGYDFSFPGWNEWEIINITL